MPLLDLRILTTQQSVEQCNIVHVIFKEILYDERKTNNQTTFYFSVIELQNDTDYHHMCYDLAESGGSWEH